MNGSSENGDGVDTIPGATAKSYTFVYYCSGHGYGHATRVVALTHELLLRQHRVHIVTNAPAHVFASASAFGAHYRHAEIDAGIVQPKAYDVARRKTVDGLRAFLEAREEKLDKEVAFLKECKADAVLVDAPFLPCAAAELAGIPSVIISNFTFDSCYSYLSVANAAERAGGSQDGRGPESAASPSSASPLSCTNKHSLLSPPSSAGTDSYSLSERLEAQEETEPPIAAEELEPLVNQAIRDYSNASLLLRLPGCIPLPSFDLDVPLPAAVWTDLNKHSFRDNIMELLGRPTASIPCRPSFRPRDAGAEPRRKRHRQVVDVPLIARPLASDIYTSEARKRVLSSLDIPEQYHIEAQKILVVSFGGQSIPRPASRPPTPLRSPSTLSASSYVGAGSGSPRRRGLRKQSSFASSESEDVESPLRGEPLSPMQLPGPSSHGAISPELQLHDGLRSYRLDTDSPSVSMSPGGCSSGTSTPGWVSLPSSSAPPAADETTPFESKTTTTKPRIRRLMTQHHLYLPGAPPALHTARLVSASIANSPQTSTAVSGPRSASGGSDITQGLSKLQVKIPARTGVSATDKGRQADEDDVIDADVGDSEDDSQDAIMPDMEDDAAEEEEEDNLLPDGWIAIVCGLSGKEKDDSLPDRFFAAPRDVYMPDLTACCDVLLGKLGYGTCSETVSTQTPFLYVPRPLFVEEFGLKRLMQQRGTALPMTRSDFEGGRWARLISTADELGREKKAAHKRETLAHHQAGKPAVPRASEVIAMEVERFMARGIGPSAGSNSGPV